MGETERVGAWVNEWMSVEEKDKLNIPDEKSVRETAQGRRSTSVFRGTKKERLEG